MRKKLAIPVLVIGLLVLGIVMLQPGRTNHQASARSMCKNNLKQIGLALHKYHDKYGSFPPAYLADDNGRPMHSWRVLILPFLDQQTLYDAYRFDEPWNGPHNRTLVDQIANCYRCPAAFKDEQERDRGPAHSKAMTNYVVITAPGAIFNGDESAKIDEIKDGPSHTILVVETREHSCHWMQPCDISPDEFLSDFEHVRNAPQPRNHHGGLVLLLADRSVRFASEEISPTDLEGILTRDGGEDLLIRKWNEKGPFTRRAVEKE